MGKITLRFFEFSFLVHSADRLTVLFPSAAHGLLLKFKGRVFPVPFGAHLELRDGSHNPLPLAAPTLTADYVTRVPEVNFVEGANYTIAPSVIDPAAPTAASLNAKLHLSGGQLDALECSLPQYRGNSYQFTARQSEVTDTIEFSLSGARGSTYHLFMNGADVLTIEDTDVVEFNNADVLGAPATGFFDLGEYVNLLQAALKVTVPQPTLAGGAIAAGIDNVCLGARLQLP